MIDHLSAVGFSTRLSDSFCGSYFVSVGDFFAHHDRGAPRKMPGKARALLTWFGKSLRPVAMTATPAAFCNVRHNLWCRVAEREEQQV